MAHAIDGTWVAEVDTPVGSYHVTLVFQSQDGRLTGSAKAGSHEVSVSDGTVRGDQVRFKLTLRRGIVPITGTVEATVRGDVLQGTGKAMGQKLDFEAQRQA